MKFIAKISLLSLVLISCHNEPLGIFFEENTIDYNSELYSLITQVAKNENSNEAITCIEFIYPVSLYNLDENYTLIGTEFLTHNEEFSAFLDNLNPDHSISISYPITTTLNDGTSFSINNNEELKEAIDACVEEEHIGYCENLLQNCVWKIGYLEDANNAYLGGAFKEVNGETTFNYNNNIYYGTWNVFFLEDELHINLHFIDENEISSYLNFDWKVTYIDNDSMLLSHDEGDMLMNQYCNEDYDECNNFDFEACALEDNSEVAEFILEDFNYCILTILQQEGDTVEVSYYHTQEDAEMEVNTIPSNQAYYNTTPNENLFVRIQNENDEILIIEITLNIITC